MAKPKTPVIISPFGNAPNVQRIDIRDRDRTVFDIGNYMLIRTQQMFKYDNLPESIPAYMLERYLQCNGQCVVTAVNGELYAMIGGLSGTPDAYYRPTQYTVANPYLNFSKTLTIGEDCIFCMNDHSYKGLLPIVNKYSTLLAENELSMYISDVMSRLMSIITAGSDSDALAAEMYLNDLEKGKLGAITTKNFMEKIGIQPYAGSYASSILSEMIEYEQYLKASMYNELGLDANYNMKRESLTTTESQMNDDALYPLIDDMLQCRQIFCDQINDLYGTNITVSKNSTWKTLEIEKDTAEDLLENSDGDDIGSDEKEEAENKEEVIADATD